MLTPNAYRPRLIDDALTDLLDAFGAVCVQGPKWCGKTWTSLHHAKSVTYLSDPAGNFSNRELAKVDPQLVLRGEQPHLVDEWQEVPPIWDAVRFSVDKTGAKGQYLLTGSFTPQRKGILHSGAGRIATINMHTMSLFETGDSSGKVSLRDLFEGPLSPTPTGEVSLEDLVHFCTRGGWPENVSANEKTARQLPKQYLQSIVEDDTSRIDGVKRNKDKLWALLHSLGRNVATTVSNRTLLADMEKHQDTKADENTLAEYLDIFNRLFLVWQQSSFHPQLRSSRRVLRSPKLHFADPSLAIGALDVTPSALIGDLQTFGYIFESLVAHDLLIYASANEARLFHFRDAKGNEIDSIIELNDGRWGGFEVKLGANQIDDAAANLLRMKDIFARESSGKNGVPALLCVICGTSNAAYTREDGVIVVPITALRP